MTERRRTPLQIASADPRACGHDVRVRSLARVPFLADLTERDLADLDARCGMRGLDTGEAVYLEGAPAERLYVVAQGVVKRVRRAPDGTDTLIGVASTGDAVGALPALGEETHRESAHALTPACLLSLTPETVDALLDAHPSVARRALTMLGARLREAEDRHHRLAAADAEERVTATLRTLAERLGVRREGRVLINAPLGRDDLAGLAGCAPETVSRVLARLRREGVIDTGRRWVAVRDLDALAAGTQR